VLGHVDEVKELILESVNARKNYKMRMPSRSSAGATRPSRSAHGRSYVYSQLSGLEDVGFNDFIKDFSIPEGDGHVASGSVAGQFAVQYKSETHCWTQRENQTSRGSSCSWKRVNTVEKQ